MHCANKGSFREGQRLSYLFIAVIKQHGQEPYKRNYLTVLRFKRVAVQDGKTEEWE